ncbi:MULTISPECIES: M23 family metallopeptidase [Streptomyces]|uniref:M23 family metallopeptidase n=1 Tax=Streptomyces TaxID=1883 RepID=UPI000D5297E6|nr:MULTISPECIES: M23 family metallopeptidase [Streptomyces]AWE51666.1 M23 family peptidase [Streptomyces nigra]MCF2539148.1 M23 family metallopeptidase [Streptomyces sp. FB2]
MSPRFSFRSPRTSAFRTRAAVLAAGLGASVVLGAGGAVAAEMNSGTGASAAVTAQSAAAKKAAAKKAVSWVAPVKKYSKSASFMQNGARWAHKHSGQDFAVPTGTQVVAAHGGTVVKAGGNGAGDGPAYGNAIVIKHGNGTYSQYAHLSRVEVKIGQVVKTGQEIAKSGNTGNSSGPHLHFEIRKTANYGSAIDPVSFLKAKGLKI